MDGLRVRDDLTKANHCRGNYGTRFIERADALDDVQA